METPETQHTAPPAVLTCEADAQQLPVAEAPTEVAEDWQIPDAVRVITADYGQRSPRSGEDRN